MSITLRYPIDKVTEITIENHQNYGVVGKRYIKNDKELITHLCVQHFAYDVAYGIGNDDTLYVTITRYNDHSKTEIKEERSYKYIFKDVNDTYDFLDTILTSDIAEAVRTHKFEIIKLDEKVVMVLEKYK